MGCAMVAGEMRDCSPTPHLCVKLTTPEHFLDGEIHFMSTAWLKAKWWSWLGRRKAGKREYRSALVCFQRVLSLFPNSVYALCYAGYCHSTLEQYEEAVKAFDHALQIKPDSAYAHAQLGRVFLHLGKPQHALEELNRAFRIQPKLKTHTAYQVPLANALAQLGQVDKALDAYKEALQYGRKAAEAHFG